MGNMQSFGLNTSEGTARFEVEYYKDSEGSPYFLMIEDETDGDTSQGAMWLNRTEMETLRFMLDKLLEDTK